MAKTAYSDIRDFLCQLYLENGRPWLLGFSGGKDSTMLALLIVRLARQKNMRLKLSAS